MNRFCALVFGGTSDNRLLRIADYPGVIRGIQLSCLVCRRSAIGLVGSMGLASLLLDKTGPRTECPSATSPDREARVRRSRS
jgi:hypothetical protein